MTHTIVVERGCGKRHSGGVYAECGIGPGGRPIEDFLLDPPLPLDTEATGVTPRGTRLVAFDHDDGPLWHIIDWIGSSYYPNVADWIEETRRFGLSRRLDPTMDFSKLTADSRILVAHARAFITNHEDFRSKLEAQPICIRYLPEHTIGDFESSTGMCASLYWYDVEGGTDVPMGGRPIMDRFEDRHRIVERTLPSFSYLARRPPEGVTPRYQVALFGSFPISNIAVIRAQDGRHEKQLARVRQSALPVSLDDA